MAELADHDRRGVAGHERDAAAQVLQRCGNAAVTGAWLADSVSGTRILGLALDGLVSADPRGQLQIQGDTATLDGTWDHVPYGRDLDAVLVVARTATGEPALVLVPTASAGVSIDEAWGSHALPWDQLQVKGASLDASLVLARGDAAEEALAWLVPLLLTGLSALQLGVVSEALERTARYTCERQQFKRPIASFQAVLHRAADGYIDREALRSTVWQAAWRLGQGRDAALQARAAKWWACEAGHRIGHSAQHLHGGIGSDLEYPIHRYFLWAKQIEFTLGGASQQLAQLGNHLATHQFEGFPL